MAAKSSGTACEKIISSALQSSMMVEVKSERFFLPKNESGNLRSFSAIETRRRMLSSYTLL